MKSLLNHANTKLPELNALELDIVRETVAVMEAAAQWPASAKMATALQQQADLRALPVGELRVMPGGWSHTKGGHAIMYVFERLSGDNQNGEFRFTVCNTGEGMNPHPFASIGAAREGHFIKSKARTSWSMEGIDAARITDALWLHCLQRINCEANDDHGPSCFYEAPLPSPLFSFPSVLLPFCPPSPLLFLLFSPRYRACDAWCSTVRSMRSMVQYGTEHEIQ